MGSTKQHCNGCHKLKLDTRLYRYTNKIQSALRFCSACANNRNDLTPAIMQKVKAGAK